MAILNVLECVSPNSYQINTKSFLRYYFAGKVILYGTASYRVIDFDNSNNILGQNQYTMNSDTGEYDFMYEHKPVEGTYKTRIDFFNCDVIHLVYLEISNVRAKVRRQQRHISVKLVRIQTDPDDASTSTWRKIIGMFGKVEGDWKRVII